jgi:hypothetical protein
MRKLALIALSLLLTSTCIVAQTVPAIQTDRPDQTECPFIVPKNMVQFENGFFREKITANLKNLVLPTVLVRYGINDNFELRMVAEYGKLSNTSGGLSPTIFGFKSKITKEKGILPEVAFIGHLVFPKLASKGLQATYFAPTFRFNMQHTLSSKCMLAYNIGAEWDGESPNPGFIYTLTTGYSFTSKFGGYIELYGTVTPSEVPDHRFDGGITYLLSDNFMLDASAGFGLSNISPKGFWGLGCSFRVNK